MNSVSEGSSSRVASTKSVESTLETKRNAQVAPGVVAQRLVGHRRAEIGAADTDVDHVADRSAGVAAPLARAHALGEDRHPPEHRVNLCDDIDAVHDQRAAARHPQRHVQDRAVLGDVDPLAGEHRLDMGAQPGLLREREQQGERLVGDPVLGVVQVQARPLGCQPLPARGIIGEQLAQVHVADRLVVAGKLGPRGTLAQRSRAGRAGHARSLSFPDARTADRERARDRRAAHGRGAALERPLPEPADRPDSAHARLRQGLERRRGRTSDRRSTASVTSTCSAATACSRSGATIPRRSPRSSR